MCEALSAGWKPHRCASLPAAFCGGFVGYTGYDTVRYGYGGKLPFRSAPADDRGLPDLHLGLYREVVVFDHATKLAFCVVWTPVEGACSVRSAFDDGARRLAQLVRRLQPGGGGGGDGARPSLPPGEVTLSLGAPPPLSGGSNMTKPQFLDAVGEAKEHIAAGDVFQVVLSQRFERRSFADPFEVYRALRVVNPSPYMIYLQARGCICVASSPEILCRVTAERGVVNRPLAGTRRRGSTPEEDAALCSELLADAKEVAEHTMLVDLGRNDVGRVAQPGSVRVDRLMDVERYSHVMHISSTVTGQLADGLSAWDALRAALPAGTVSGAPKVRAMQLIDELEPTRRGPYGGGIGIAGFTGEMDSASSHIVLHCSAPPCAATPRLTRVRRPQWRSRCAPWWCPPPRRSACMTTAGRRARAASGRSTSRRAPASWPTRCPRRNTRRRSTRRRAWRGRWTWRRLPSAGRDAVVGSLSHYTVAPHPPPLIFAWSCRAGARWARPRRRAAAPRFSFAAGTRPISHTPRTSPPRARPWAR